MDDANLPQPVDVDAPLFTISVAARLADMHPQTLRSYDRMGLVEPRRSRGRGRRYSRRDIGRLRLIQHLSQSEGVNLEGIRRVLAMQDEIDLLRGQNEQLVELLRLARVSPDNRLFAADAGGGVHLSDRARLFRAPRALGR